MEIKVAEHCGFCYGVKRAVELAQKAATDRVQGATLGPLIHNPQLIAELASEALPVRTAWSSLLPVKRLSSVHTARGLKPMRRQKNKG